MDRTWYITEIQRTADGTEAHFTVESNENPPEVRTLRLTAGLLAGLGMAVVESEGKAE